MPHPANRGNGLGLMDIALGILTISMLILMAAGAKRRRIGPSNAQASLVMIAMTERDDRERECTSADSSPPCSDEASAEAEILGLQLTPYGTPEATPRHA